LGKNQGMLFIFEKKDTHSFWMKDMKFSIDIIWLNENKEVVFIKENAKPEDFPQNYIPTEQSLYVLEFNEGFVKENNISNGYQFHWK